MDGLIFIWVCSDCRRIRFVFQIGSERWTVGTVIYKWLYLICVSRHHHPIAINNEGVSHAICCVSVWLSNKKAWGRTSIVSLSKQSCWQNISAWLSTDCCSLCHHHFTALLVTAWILLSCTDALLWIWIWRCCVSHCQWHKRQFEIWVARAAGLRHFCRNLIWITFQNTSDKLWYFHRPYYQLFFFSFPRLNGTLTTALFDQ